MRTLLFRLIGMLEVAGGFYGVTAMLRRLLPLGSTHDSVVTVIGLALFGFVLVAGVLLLEGSERGIRLSRWAQLLQLPLIATPVFSYALHSGAFVNVFATLQASPRLASTGIWRRTVSCWRWPGRRCRGWASTCWHCCPGWRCGCGKLNPVSR